MPGSSGSRSVSGDARVSWAEDTYLSLSSGIPEEVAALLRIAAFCLYGVFLTSVVVLFLPPRLLDPAWQLLSINTLFSASPFPLLATCCLLLGRSADPRMMGEFHLLRGRMRLASRLASFGFVLLVPLQVSALWRTAILAEVPTNRLISTLSVVRAEIQSSRSQGELNAALAKLPGNPRLPANFNLSILDFQKATSQRLAQDIEIQKRQQGERVRNRSLMDAFNLAKNSVLATLLSVFFAAAAGVPIRFPTLLRISRFQQIVGNLLEAWREWRDEKREQRRRRAYARNLPRISRLQQIGGNIRANWMEWLEERREHKRRRAYVRHLQQQRRQFDTGTDAEDDNPLG